MLLTLIEVKKEHTGEQLAVYIFIVLDQYHMKDFLSYFIIDNAIINNYRIISILHKLFEKNRLRYNSQQYRLRCNGYIINLLI